MIVKDVFRDGYYRLEKHAQVTYMHACDGQGATDALLLSPGFTDIQVNGFAGVDFNDPATTLEAFEHAISALNAVGVTRVLPTVITASEKHMCACLQMIHAATQQSERVQRAVVGVHVEGPFISPEDGARGAHPLADVQAPDVALFNRFQAAAGGLVRLITIAAEYPQAPAFIQSVTKQGVRVAIGHSMATNEQLIAAASAGACLVTHLGNGVPRELLRHPNIIWDALANDDLHASVIFDGFHLPDSVIKVFWRAKQPKLILTSDAVALAGMPAGIYEGQVGGKVELHANGKLTMYKTEYLAGSASSLLDGVNTALRVTGASLAEVLTTVTTTPEQLLGFAPASDYLLLKQTPDGVEVQDTLKNVRFVTS